MPRKRSPSQVQNKLSHQIGQSYVSFGCVEWAVLHNVSIARCILKDAPIVILDEATASVDADNESHIQAAISELVRGKTLLVIAHRLNTIESADQILVVRDGRIAEKGRHEELMAAGGLYHAMVAKRSEIRGFAR